MPRRSLPMLEPEVGATLHNKVVGEITTQIMSAMPTVPDRMVLLSSIVAGVIYHSARKEPHPPHALLEIVITEAQERLRQLRINSSKEPRK